MRPTLRILTQVPIPPSTATASAAHASSPVPARSPVTRRAAAATASSTGAAAAVPIKTRSAGPLLTATLWAENIDASPSDGPVRASSAPKTCCAAALRPLSALASPSPSASPRAEHHHHLAPPPPLFQASATSPAPAPPPVGFLQPPPPPPDARTTPLARRYIAFLRALNADLEAEGLTYHDPAQTLPPSAPVVAADVGPLMRHAAPAHSDNNTNTASAPPPAARATAVVHTTLSRYFPDVVTHPRFTAAAHALDHDDGTLPAPSVQRRVSFITEFLTTHVNPDGTVRA